jgi:hypothetical protein
MAQFNPVLRTNRRLHHLISFRHLIASKLEFTLYHSNLLTYSEEYLDLSPFLTDILSSLTLISMITIYITHRKTKSQLYYYQ